MPSNSSSRSTTLGLAGGVFVTGCLGEFAEHALLAVTSPSDIAPALVIGIVSPVLLSLGTLVVVFALCRRIPIRSLTISRIGLTALFTGILARYVGLILGAVARGGRIPSPAEVVRIFAPNVFDLILLTLSGTIVAVLWSLVSTFGAIGVDSLMTGTANSVSE
jgi:hypothetical protein